MATTGGKFLRLSNATCFTISDHALLRLEEHTDMEPTRGLASVLFEHSRQVNSQEMRLLGYRPAYGRRLMRGEKSWYFRFQVFCQELIAVIGESASPGEYVWLTTYSPNRQTELLRVADFESLAVA